MLQLTGSPLLIHTRRCYNSSGLPPLSRDGPCVHPVPRRDLWAGWTQGPSLLKRYALDRDHTNREADELIGVAEARTRDAGDTGLLEEREGILLWAQAAPVVDGGIVVYVDLGEEVLLLVDAAQLRYQARAPETIEGAHLLYNPGSRADQLQVGHKAQLPFAGQRCHRIAPARRDGLGYGWVAACNPAEALARQAMGL